MIGETKQGTSEGMIGMHRGKQQYVRRTLKIYTIMLEARGEKLKKKI